MAWRSAAPLEASQNDTTEAAWLVFLAIGSVATSPAACTAPVRPVVQQAGRQDGATNGKEDSLHNISRLFL